MRGDNCVIAENFHVMFCAPFWWFACRLPVFQGSVAMLSLVSTAEGKSRYRNGAVVVSHQSTWTRIANALLVPLPSVCKTHAYEMCPAASAHGGK